MVDELRFLAFVGVVGGFTLAAWGINRRWLRAVRASEDALQVFLLAVALAVGTGTFLGLAGLFRPVPAAVVVVAMAALGVRLLAKTPARLRVPAVPLTPASRAVLCLGIGTVLANVFLLWSAPSLLTDVLLYHLAFPARWLQEGRIVRVPSAFEAGAHAYFPVNQEVLCVWWMLPFHSEVLARFVQVPFFFAAALAVYVLSTARGLSRDAGAALAGAFLLFGPLLDEAVGGPYNDVTLAALFLIGLYACDVAGRDRLHGSVLFGVALGLFLGTKVTAIPYSLVLLLSFLLARPGRQGALVAGLLAVGLGGTWYAWNWAQTGDPLYPSDLVVGGVPLARGLFDPRIFPSHRSWGRVLAALAGKEFRFALTPWLCGALAVCWLLSHARRKGNFAASTSPLLVLLLYLWLVPVEDARYLFPCYSALALSAGVAASLLGLRWSLLLPVALAGIAFREDMALAEGTDRAQVCIIAAAASFLVWTLLRMRPVGWRHASFGCAGVLLVATGTFPRAWRQYEEVAYAPESALYDTHYSGEGAAWTRLHKETRDHPATIAYAGTGLCFPLYGRRLANRVLYIPVRAGGSGLVHEFGEHLGRGDFIGNALPIDATERFVRSPANGTKWYEAIAREKVDYLLVTGTEWDGAPLLERTWAEKDGEWFHPVFLSLHTMVYRVVR